MRSVTDKQENICRQSFFNYDRTPSVLVFVKPFFTRALLPYERTKRR